MVDSARNITYDSGKQASLHVCDAAKGVTQSKMLRCGVRTSLCGLQLVLSHADADAQAAIVFNAGHIAWVLTGAALVWIMVPGIGFIYAGLLRRKNTLSMVYLSLVSTAVCTLQVRAFASDLLPTLTPPQWLFWG